MFDPKHVLQLLDDERPRIAPYARVIERLSDVTRFRAIDGSYPVVVAADAFNEQNADEVIAREVAYHRALAAVPFEWTVYGHHTPSDLLERLARQGFQVGPCEAVLIYDLTERQRWTDDAHVNEANASSTSPVVRRVSNAKDIADFRHVAEAVFEKNYAFTSNELLDAIRAGSTEHSGYVAYAGPNGPPVSIGRVYTHPQSQFGGLYGGGTLAAFRGQGFYRAVVAARARDAIAAGARYLRVDALPTSQPILKRLGFTRVTDTWPCMLER